MFCVAPDVPIPLFSSMQVKTQQRLHIERLKLLPLRPLVSSRSINAHKGSEACVK